MLDRINQEHWLLQDEIKRSEPADYVNYLLYITVESDSWKYSTSGFAAWRGWCKARAQIFPYTFLASGPTCAAEKCSLQCFCTLQRNVPNTHLTPRDGDILWLSTLHSLLIATCPLCHVQSTASCRGYISTDSAAPKVTWSLWVGEISGKSSLHWLWLTCVCGKLTLSNRVKMTILQQLCILYRLRIQAIKTHVVRTKTG